MKTGNNFLLLAVFLSVAAAAFIFIKSNFYSFPVNARCHLEAVAGAYQVIGTGTAGLFDVFSRLKPFGVGSYYPVLPHTCYLASLLFKPDYAALFFVNLACYLFTALAVRRISAVFVGPGYLSTLSAVIFMLYPAVVFMLTSCEIQMFPLAFIAWGFYFYLKSENFLKLRPALWFCLFFILSMHSDRLTPGVFLASCLFNPRNFRSRRSGLAAAAAGAAITLACVPHYSQWVEIIKNPNCVAAMITRNNVPAARIFELLKSDPGYLLAHVYYYPAALSDQLLGAFFTGLLCLAGWGLRHFRHPLKNFLLLSLFFPLCIFTLFPKKDWVYLFPLLTILPAVTVSGLSGFGNRRWQGLILALVIAAGALNFPFLFGFPGFLRPVNFTDFLANARRLNYPNMITERSAPCDNGDTEAAQRFKAIL